MEFDDFFEIFIQIFKIYCYISITLLPLYLFKTFFVSKYKPNSDYYYRKEWYHFLKVLWAKPYVQNYKNSFAKIIKKESPESIEQPRKLTTFMRYDSQTIYGVDQKGNSIFIKISLRENRLAELCFQLRLTDGSIYQLPEHPFVVVCSIPERKWCAAGLEINILEPFQKLKITYNGLLRNCIRNTTTTETGAVTHFKFSFIWSAASTATFFPQNTTTHELANAVAVEPWKNSKWIKLLGFQTGYNQYGMLLGQIFFEKNPSGLVVRLISARNRTWGPSEARTLHRTLTLFGVKTNGTIFTINVKSFINGCKELQIGTMFLPNRTVVPIEECDISLPDFIENGIVPGAFTFRFTGNGVIYDCTAFSCKTTIATLKNDEIKGYKTKIVKTKYMINGDEATGFGVFWYRHRGEQNTLPSYIIRAGVQIVEPERRFVAPFTRPECRSEYLAGIKGTALALLTVVDTKKFRVVDGFCVLVPAFRAFLQEQPRLMEEFVVLKKCVFGGIVRGDFLDTCNRIKSLFVGTKLPQQIHEDIINELQLLKFKSTSTEQHCWAVRLSTVDEHPTTKTQTFLDCFSDADVTTAILSCWSSVFTPDKIIFRKKRGLPIICDMAVIVQPAIHSDTAGTLKTCHPETADPSTFIITGNYGLGIDLTEADTVNISRTWDKKLSLSDTSIGNKNHQIIISKNGIKRIENTNNKKMLCLTYEQIMNVSEVGVLLESTFEGPLNIKWTFFKDQLYILNMKRIRFQYDWTNFDLIHDNDTAILSDDNIIKTNTTDNILSGFNSNLTHSICVKFLEESLQQIYSKPDLMFVYKILSIYKHKVGINIFESILRNVDKDLTEELKIDELVTTGDFFINEDLHKKALKKNQPKHLFNWFKYCWFSSDYAEEATILSDAIRIISYNEFSSFEYFNIIKRNLHLLKHVFKLNTFVSYSNVCYQKLWLNLIQDEKQDVSSDQFFETLDFYSNNSVYDIPKKIELMVILIKNKHISDDFCKMKPTEAVDYLETNHSDVMVLFKKFMKKYGHRAVNEFDLKSIPWEKNTFAVIRILQILVEKTTETIEHQNKSIPKQKQNGRILRWIESKVINSFINKEKTLSSLAKTVNKFRNAFHELAEKLVEEEKLPDIGLIFYFTWSELEQIVATKNPKLIEKAIKRKTSSAELKRNDEIQSRIIGRSVVKGHVQARACVIDNIRQVNQIREGDILVTNSLDVGWSPYFPILSGFVTENGCLTSQGAIAVRKRNLPSITNAKNATNIYKTGDILLLIANNGVVEKIED